MYLTNRCHVVVHNFMFSDISQVMSNMWKKTRTQERKLHITWPSLSLIL